MSPLIPQVRIDRHRTGKKKALTGVSARAFSVNKLLRILVPRQGTLRLVISQIVLAYHSCAVGSLQVDVLRIC